MDIDIRAVGDDQLEAFVRATYRAFGSHPKPEEVEVHRVVLGGERLLGAFDGGELVGTAAAVSLPLTVPGGELPMGGVTEVGVVPSHRRRGILTALMRRQVEDLHRAGVAVAGLWASESSIYGRFGYGLATMAASLEIERERSGFARSGSSPGTVRLVGREEALRLMPGVYDRIRPTHPGMLGRSARRWQAQTADLEPWRDGASALWYAAYEEGGEPRGYVTYRVRHQWAGGLPAGELRVEELMAETTEAYAALWRYCLDVDLMRTITARERSPEEPLVHLLAEPRRLRITLQDGLWVRPVDVPAALSARRYARDGRVVLAVRDALCPWNDGRFELDGGPEGADCHPSDHDPDVELEAADLGAAYLGGTRLRTLHRAGRVRELRPGAVAAADRMLSWDPPPWCPEIF